MEFFDLAVLFTAGGALVGGGAVKVITSAGKNLGIVPETGRGVLVAAALASFVLIGLAGFDADFLRDGVEGQDIATLIFAWAAVYTASVGIHETAVKVQRIATDSTNTSGADTP